MDFLIRMLKRTTPVRIISLGFAIAILIGSGLLMLPCSLKAGVHLHYIDALYTATSAICVTGLIAVDAGDTFTPLGQFFLAVMIQVGGLGVTAIGAGIILAIGRKINLKGRTLIREAMNLDSGKGMIRFIRAVFFTTILIESVGAVLSFFVFSRNYPPLKAIGISIFHSIAAFNNSGFDILGGMQNLIPYRDDVFLNLVTCALIFFGGIGFLVICELGQTRLHWSKMSMHTRVVLSVSFFLTFGGMILLKMTEDFSWLVAFFHSVSARTAGFSTYPLGDFHTPGLLVMMALMFIGASPGSTAGGIKTSTFFVLIQGIKSAATNHTEKAFHYAIPKGAFRKASVITILGGSIVFVCTYLLSILEPQIPLIDLLFESVSAFGTVGLSTGITTQLCTASKLLCILVMYIGRLGPLTIFSIWHYSLGERVRYPEGNISIG